MSDGKKLEKNDIEIRKNKQKEIEKSGYNLYPDRFEKSHNIDEILKIAESEKLSEADDIKPSAQVFSVAGRIMTLRVHGKLAFANLQDAKAKIQIAFSNEILGENFDLIENFDLGDYLGIVGKLFITHKGEVTLMTEEFLFLGKALRQLPEKFHGLKDQEALYRQRYLDLLVNEDTRNRFKIRNSVIKFLRNYLENNDFDEVETPILSSSASGALAKPFITHHNALDEDFYLRIAPETYLKRLIIGGYEKVFEFAKCFRNEGIDPSHLQEFTMLEYYSAYWNWQDNMKFTEQMISSMVKEVFGGYETNVFDQKINWQPPYDIVTMRDIIYKDSKIDIDTHQTVEKLKLEIAKRGIEIDDIENFGYGNLVDALYKKVSRNKIIKPTFLISHPIALSPLARNNNDNPDVADRFQLIVNGWEIINAYSELVDPVEQIKRLKEQSELRASGDEEAMMMDEDYVKAMEYGMPPISGWGMGIDRIVALLTSQENLKDCIYFPLMREKNKKSKTEMKDIEITMKEAGIDRGGAEKLLKKYLKDDDYLYKHSLAVEAVMKKFAKHFKRNEDVWALAGLLHDLDYPLTKNEPEKHGLITEEILSKHGVHPEIIYAIKAHNHLHELTLDTLLAKTLYSVEELTGLIVACALVQIDKKLSSVSVESINKKFKQKSFASGVNRAIIRKAEEFLGIELSEIFRMSLEAMQEISDDLNL